MTLLQSNDPTETEKTDTVNTNRLDDQKDNAQVIAELWKPAVDVIPEAIQNSKYYRGVLSSVVNNITSSGSVVFGVLDSLNRGLLHGRMLYGSILLAGALIIGAFWFFVKNALQVCQCRYFLEASSYENVSVQKLLFMIRVRKWWNVAKIMFFKWWYLMLWNMTVIGGIIKFYSYLLVPYIVAENPNVTRKEAFALSRAMMQGNKWNTFLLSMSFVGWSILSAVTGGVTGIFYSNGYFTATITELYLQLRRKAIAEKISCYECLNDHYIGVQPLLPEGAECLPTEYPSTLFSIPEYKRRQWVKVDYRRDYSIWSLILLFFTFSAIGWLWEVSLHLSTDGFVNRGVMQGPWLPIYGSGGVAVLVLLKKVRDNKLLTFILTVVICGVLEYGTSLFLEVTKGKKWWDYSGYLLNINGRVCAEGLLVFGLGGCAFIYFAAPLFDELYKKIPVKMQMLLCVALLSVFATDFLYSRQHPNEGKGITDYQTRTVPPGIERKKVKRYEG